MQLVGKAKRGGLPSKPRLLKVSLQVPESSTWSQVDPKPLQSSYGTDSTQGALEGVSSTIRAASFEPSYLYPAHFSPSIAEQHVRDLSPFQRSESGTCRLDESRRFVSQEDILIERFGGGRSNPFAQYPIEMNFRAHELIDHSQSLQLTRRV